MFRSRNLVLWGVSFCLLGSSQWGFGDEPGSDKIKDYSVLLEAGIGVSTGAGAGPTAAVTLAPNIGKLKLKSTSPKSDGEMSNRAFEVHGAAQLSGEPGDGAPTLPVAEAHARGIVSQNPPSDGKSSADTQAFRGVGVRRNVGLDRQWDVQIQEGTKKTSADGRVRETSTGELGLTRSGGKLLPYLQGRYLVEMKDCLRISDSRDLGQVCVAVAGGVALGLLQAEASGELHMTYESRKLTTNGTKIYITGGGTATASYDLAGPHTNLSEGVSVGLATP